VWTSSANPHGDGDAGGGVACSLDEGSEEQTKNQLVVNAPRNFNMMLYSVASHHLMISKIVRYACVSHSTILIFISILR